MASHGPILEHWRTTSDGPAQKIWCLLAPPCLLHLQLRHALLTVTTHPSQTHLCSHAHMWRYMNAGFFFLLKETC